MLHALTALTLPAAAGATPTPTPTLGVDPDLVTPGVVGFLATALLAVAVIFLILDMMRRIRRGRVRADIQEELDAEAEQDAQEARGAEATETDAADADADAGGEPSAKD